MCGHNRFAEKKPKPAPPKNIYNNNNNSIYSLACYGVV